MHDRREELSLLPKTVRADLAAVLAADEPILAAFLADLDAALSYAPAAIVLTDRRVLGFGCAQFPTSTGTTVRGWTAWPVEPLMTTSAREHAGLGTLDLALPGGLVARWRYTQARAKESRRFVEGFESVQSGEAIPPAEAPGVAAGGLPEDAPAKAVRATSVFLRLLKFGRPQAGAIVLGFLLTVASTAAGLIPPYLTEP